MHYQFLVEDRSGGELINILMQKLIADSTTVTYDCKSFKGIGGLTKKNTVKETKTGKLLDDLATYLRAFNKKWKNYEAVVMVVLDNDTRNKDVFLNELNQVSENNDISIDHVFCIAVEEMEAWLLGDEAAVISAYPSANKKVLSSYVQDSICGTWEVLADAVYSGGIKNFLKDNPTYADKGIYKSEWSRKIGEYMNVNNNKSPSFNYFIAQIKSRLSPLSNH